ncbi:MAG: hypothetical protein RIR70_1775, partial [Pseudomonadota bacterium]
MAARLIPAPWEGVAVFKKLSDYVVAGSLVVILAAAGLSLLYRETARKNMVTEKQTQVTALAQMLTDNLWPQLDPLLSAPRNATPADLAKIPSAKVIEQNIQKAAAGLNIIEARIVDRRGRVVFSTLPGKLGPRPENEIETTGPNVMTTSVGLRPTANAPPRGWLEMQLDLTSLQWQIANSQVGVVAATLLVLGSVWVAVVLLAARALRLIRGHEHARRHAQRELEETQKNMEHTVQARTLELQRAIIELEEEIAERRRNEEIIREMAYYDSLTRLPNRMFFKAELERALSDARIDERCLAVMFIDLDHFKRINDTLGHHMGDELLRLAGARLYACLRNEEEIEGHIEPTAAKVARLGGDEFTLLVPDVGSPENAAELAQRCIDAFSHPFKLDTFQVQVTPSIGIACYPDDGETAESLLKNADTAMYHAKQKGRENFVFYAPEMSTLAYAKLALENRLRGALDHSQFALHYQPKVDARSGQLKGLEALLRWHHPDQGLIVPDDFITLAEETRLIIPIGEWVFREAARQHAAWRDAGLGEIPIAVNISGAHFRQSHLLSMVCEVLSEYDIADNQLEIEVTESLLMDDIDRTASTLAQLRDAGIRVTIDDFGTGYSSLSYLRRFPVDALKIDRCFVEDITKTAQDAAITRAIIMLARSLELEVIAEG